MTKKETKPTDEIKFSFDDLGGVHDAIQVESSEPNENFIEQTTAEEVATAQAKTSGQTDKTGTAFDPELHAVDKDGNPSVTPLGKFRKKRGASKVATVTQAQEAQTKIANAKAAASAAVDMSIQSLELLLGAEWTPVQQDGLDERNNLKDATANYFIAKEINDFPPGVALSVVVMAYAMPRIVGGPETKTRLAKAKIWLSEKYNNVRKKKNAAQPNSRNDRKRKDNDSEKVVQPEQAKRTRNAST